MPAILDHPLRLARLRAGVGQKELADAIGRHRSTIAAIEEGRTNDPEAETVQAIADVLHIDAAALESDLSKWRERRRAQGPQLTPTARTVLEQSPNWVAEQRSFQSWREKISPSPTSFASMLGLNRTVVANYEKGIRERGMPDTLSHAILTVLGVNMDYLIALQRLEPSHDEEE